MRIFLRVITGVLLVSLLAASVALAGGTGPMAVVPNRGSGDLSIIDTTQDLEVARVPLGLYPHFAVSAPLGRYVYVASERQTASGQASIWQVDLQTQSVSRSIQYQILYDIFDFAISPDGETLATVDYDGGTLYVFRASDLTFRYSKRLCTQCNGTQFPLFAATKISFSDDSATLNAVVPNQAVFLAIDVATGATIASSPSGSPAGDSLAFPDMQRFSDFWMFPVAIHPYYGVRLFDGGGAFSLPLPGAAGPYPYDVLPLALYNLHLLLSGSISYEPGPDFLRIFVLEANASLDLPSSESLRWLRYNPVTNEVWGTCTSAILTVDCSPFKVDVFSLNTIQPATTLTGPTGLIGGLPTFSADYRSYYQPLPSDAVWVVDAVTHQPRTTIPVGTDPQRVVIQGDSKPTEID